jgi:hypothetical protein
LQKFRIFFEITHNYANFARGRPSAVLDTGAKQGIMGNRPNFPVRAMLITVETLLQEAQIPEIWETAEEKHLSNRELKTRCFSFARQHFQRKTFKNKSLRQDIAVSRGGLGEWKTVTKSREQAISIKILDILLETGTFWKEGPPKNQEPNIEKVIYLRQKCRINDTPYEAVITVKVYKARGYHKYYHHYLEDMILNPGT